MRPKSRTDPASATTLREGYPRLPLVQAEFAKAYPPADHE